MTVLAVVSVVSVAVAGWENEADVTGQNSRKRSLKDYCDALNKQNQTAESVPNRGRVFWAAERTICLRDILSRPEIS